jgi:hypothetical protein
MVQFCPKCGTKEPDDEAVFCNKCGSRLPPPVPVPQENICPGCGTHIRDIQAVFCDRCGSPLRPAPPAPVRRAGAQQAAARPAVTRERCRFCGAPLAIEDPEYSNECGAYLRKTAAPAPAGEPLQPAAEEIRSAPVAAAPPEDTGYTEDAGLPEDTGSPEDTEYPEDSAHRKALLKRGLAVGAVIVILLILAASITGIIPGMNQSSNATGPLPTQTSGLSQTRVPTTHWTPAHMPTAAPVSPAPATLSPTPVTTTVPPTTAPVNVTTTVHANASANATANASVTMTTTIPVTDPSAPLSLGQSAYDGKGKLTVHDISFKDKMSDPTPSYAIGKQYMIVNITYENLQKNATMDVDLTMLKVTDGGGFPYEPASDILLENVYTGKFILPQEKRTGNLLFIVPPQATFLKMEYSSGGQKRATIQLT